jgi:hypothetical protein
MADPVELYASLAPIDGPRNPGEYDWRLYNRRYGLYVTASVAQPESIQRRLAAGGTGTLSSLIGRFRQGCRLALLDGIEAGEPQAGLLATYVAGQRSAVGRQINGAPVSGTAHLLPSAARTSRRSPCSAASAGCPRRAARRPGRLCGDVFCLAGRSECPARPVIMAILASADALNRLFNSGTGWPARSCSCQAPADLFSRRPMTSPYADLAPRPCATFRAA